MFELVYKNFIKQNYRVKNGKTFIAMIIIISKQKTKTKSKIIKKDE